MHEWSLVRALLRQLETLAEQHPHSCITQVRVRVGEFSGVEPELLKGAYQQLVPSTTMRGAELLVDSVRLEAECRNCGNRFAVEQFHFECPVCCRSLLTICGGEELMLESVVLEDREP
jgi:hydrogenase nickel incorporation protein HypA/HybF